MEDVGFGVGNTTGTVRGMGLGEVKLGIGVGEIGSGVVGSGVGVDGGTEEMARRKRNTKNI